MYLCYIIWYGIYFKFYYLVGVKLFQHILEPMTSFILMDSSLLKATGEYVNSFTLISNINMETLTLNLDF